MAKIILATSNDFQRTIYADTFKKERFEILEAKDKRELFDLLCQTNPDVIFLDLSLKDFDSSELNDFLNLNPPIKKVPILVYSIHDNEKAKEIAFKIEAKDYIIGSQITPKELISRLKILLGYQKTYLISISEEDNLEKTKELASDLGQDSVHCSKCGLKLSIFLIRDLSRGENYFKISFICPNCQQYGKIH